MSSLWRRICIRYAAAYAPRACYAAAGEGCCAGLQEKMRSVVGRFGISGAAQTLKIKVSSAWSVVHASTGLLCAAS